MKRIMLAATLMGALTLATPTPASAGPDQECLDKCDEDFSGGGYVAIATRGWCYIIRCLL